LLKGARDKMEIKKSDLEWVIEQLEYFEEHAKDIEEEAYNCRKVVEKILNKRRGKINGR